MHKATVLWTSMTESLGSNEHVRLDRFLRMSHICNCDISRLQCYSTLWKYILMPLVIWLVCKTQIKWVISSFIAKTHVVLSLPWTLVTGTMLVTSMLCSASGRLSIKESITSNISNTELFETKIHKIELSVFIEMKQFSSVTSVKTATWKSVNANQVGKSLKNVNFGNSPRNLKFYNSLLCLAKEIPLYVTFNLTKIKWRFNTCHFKYHLTKQYCLCNSAEMLSQWNNGNANIKMQTVVWRDIMNWNLYNFLNTLKFIFIDGALFGESGHVE